MLKVSDSESPEMWEEITQRKYEVDYDVSQASIIKPSDVNDYFFKMVKIRLDLIKKYGTNKKVLDLCCGTGDYLFESRDVIKMGVGVDFSKKMINEAILKKNKMNITNIEFINCNAKRIPYKNGAFDLAYSFSSLYYIPEVEKVIFEVARLLKRKSVAILEFGNLYSLNTIVCKAYPEWAAPFHIKIRDMKKIIRNAGLEIVEWRRFQILPLWGGRPKWLKPLLHPLWKKILQIEIKGKMIDEWICNAPLFKNFCFRHILVCKKIA